LQNCTENSRTSELCPLGRISRCGWVLGVLLGLPLLATAHPPILDLKALQVEVMLDRSGFSPGVIGGRLGPNGKKALDMFRGQGRQEWVVAPLLVAYRLTAEDLAGPYAPIPASLDKQATMEALGYPSLLEALGERFHCTPALLRQLNPGTRLMEGAEIQVPNVNTMMIQGKEPAQVVVSPREANSLKPEVVVTVMKGASALTVTNASGKVIFYAPVTTGSRHDPLPLGEWKVNGVKFNPTFRYDPSLFCNSKRKDRKATLPAGPRNPTGLVWIDLSKAHYGIHGTSNPSTIGRSQSHGCVRLTNWDALWVAHCVKPGTHVLFVE